MAKNTKDPRSTLPKRFRPFLDQAQTETAIRYGGQQDALNSILASLTHDYGQQAQAQQTAGMSTMGLLRGADKNLQHVYTDAGLTPGLLANLANSPTGQRLAGELASGRAGIQQQLLGAAQGQEYQQGHLFDQYQQDVGKVSDQNVSLARERGLYGSSLLDQLIGADRATRHAANTAFKAQQHADQQNALNNAISTGNALIGQGLQPVIGKDGSVSIGAPLPGGKADPNAPANQPKVKPAKPIAPATVKAATGTFSQALHLAKTLWEQGIGRHAAAMGLMTGRKATPGEKVYDPRTGKPVLNPDGTQKTTKGKSEVPSFKADQPLLQAALDLAYDGHVSPVTVRLLHKAYGNGIVGALGLNTNRKAPRPTHPQSTPTGVFGGVTAPTIG